MLKRIIKSRLFAGRRKKETSSEIIESTMKEKEMDVLTEINRTLDEQVLEAFTSEDKGDQVMQREAPPNAIVSYLTSYEDDSTLEQSRSAHPKEQLSTFGSGEEFTEDNSVYSDNVCGVRMADRMVTSIENSTVIPRCDRRMLPNSTTPPNQQTAHPMTASKNFDFTPELKSFYDALVNKTSEAKRQQSKDTSQQKETKEIGEISRPPPLIDDRDSVSSSKALNDERRSEIPKISQVTERPQPQMPKGFDGDVRLQRLHLHRIELEQKLSLEKAKSKGQNETYAPSSRDRPPRHMNVHYGGEGPSAEDPTKILTARGWRSTAVPDDDNNDNVPGGGCVGLPNKNKSLMKVMGILQKPQKQLQKQLQQQKLQQRLLETPALLEQKTETSQQFSDTGSTSLRAESGEVSQELKMISTVRVSSRVSSKANSNASESSDPRKHTSQIPKSINANSNNNNANISIPPIHEGADNFTIGGGSETPLQSTFYQDTILKLEQLLPQCCISFLDPTIMDESQKDTITPPGRPNFVPKWFDGGGNQNVVIPTTLPEQNGNVDKSKTIVASTATSTATTATTSAPSTTSNVATKKLPITPKASAGKNEFSSSYRNKFYPNRSRKSSSPLRSNNNNPIIDDETARSFKQPRNKSTPAAENNNFSVPIDYNNETSTAVGVTIQNEKSKSSSSTRKWSYLADEQNNNAGQLYNNDAVKEVCLSPVKEMPSMHTEEPVTIISPRMVNDFTTNNSDSNFHGNDVADGTRQRSINNVTTDIDTVSFSSRQFTVVEYSTPKLINELKHSFSNHTTGRSNGFDVQQEDFITTTDISSVNLRKPSDDNSKHGEQSIISRKISTKRTTDDSPDASTIGSQGQISAKVSWVSASSEISSDSIQDNKKSNSSIVPTRSKPPSPVASEVDSRTSRYSVPVKHSDSGSDNVEVLLTTETISTGDDNLKKVSSNRSQADSIARSNSASHRMIRDVASSHSDIPKLPFVSLVPDPPGDALRSSSDSQNSSQKDNPSSQCSSHAASAESTTNSIVRVSSGTTSAASNRESSSNSHMNGTNSIIRASTANSSSASNRDFQTDDDNESHDNESKRIISNIDKSIEDTSIDNNSFGKVSTAKVSIDNASIDKVSFDNSSIGKASTGKASISKASIGNSSKANASTSSACNDPEKAEKKENVVQTASADFYQNSKSELDIRDISLHQGKNDATDGAPSNQNETAPSAASDEAGQDLQISVLKSRSRSRSRSRSISTASYVSLGRFRNRSVASATETSMQKEQKSVEPEEERDDSITPKKDKVSSSTPPSPISITNQLTHGSASELTSTKRSTFFSPKGKQASRSQDSRSDSSRKLHPFDSPKAKLPRPVAGPHHAATYSNDETRSTVGSMLKEKCSVPVSTSWQDIKNLDHFAREEKTERDRSKSKSVSKANTDSHRSYPVSQSRQRSLSRNRISSNATEESSLKSPKLSRSSGNAHYFEHKRKTRAEQTSPMEMSLTPLEARDPILSTSFFMNANDYDGSTLTTRIHEPSYSGYGNEERDVSTLTVDDSSAADPWEEITGASRVIVKAINRIETVKSEDTDYESTADQVEQALDILRNYASSLGIKERELLLLAVNNDSKTDRARGDARESFTADLLRFLRQNVDTAELQMRLMESDDHSEDGS